ncbi:dead end protein homolog 1-like [Spea bombifrons]|uniref:dead end protein homolog 1-like n=1 Tax=Spea bombifrons TaxID=233779 RepID=UPI00234AE47F|nr:dead end protein homolog 1-like [Spea bombifrons]
MDQSQVCLNGLNDDNKMALITWMKVTNASLIQVNGQRKYGGPPPGWSGEIPGSGTEIYIGKIPQVIYEDKLIPLFERAGKLYEFRLMMAFSGLNRGFAYARYENKRRAFAAIAAFNGYEILAGHKIVVCRSTEKCELLLYGVPSFLDHGAVERFLEENTSGVEEVVLYQSPAKEDVNLAIVKYRSHRAAAVAKKNICQDLQPIRGHLLTVDWLKSEVKHYLQSNCPQLGFHVPRSMHRKPNTDNKLSDTRGCFENGQLIKALSHQTASTPPVSVAIRPSSAEEFTPRISNSHGPEVEDVSRFLGHAWRNRWNTDQMQSRDTWAMVQRTLHLEALLKALISRNDVQEKPRDAQPATLLPGNQNLTVRNHRGAGTGRGDGERDTRALDTVETVSQPVILGHLMQDIQKASEEVKEQVVAV